MRLRFLLCFVFTLGGCVLEPIDGDRVQNHTINFSGYTLAPDSVVEVSVYFESSIIKGFWPVAVVRSSTTSAAFPFRISRPLYAYEGSVQLTNPSFWKWTPDSDGEGLHQRARVRARLRPNDDTDNKPGLLMFSDAGYRCLFTRAQQASPSNPLDPFTVGPECSGIDNDGDVRYEVSVENENENEGD